MFGLIVGALVTHFVAKFGAFTIFKLYPEGYGAGFNLYWKGWRVLGLDWHQWVIRQDLKTRKPLPQDQQYALNRPHIDLPLWEYHHWPWTQLPHSSEAAAKKAAKDVIRAAAAEKKAERKARRAAVLAERAAKGDASSLAAVDANSDATSETLTSGLSVEAELPSPLDPSPNDVQITESVLSVDSSSESKPADSNLPDIYESSKTTARKTREPVSTIESILMNAEDTDKLEIDSKEALVEGETLEN